MVNLEKDLEKLLKTYKKKDIVLEIVKNKRFPKEKSLLGLNYDLHISDEEQEELLKLIPKTKRERQMYFLRKYIMQNDERIKTSPILSKITAEEEKEIKMLKDVIEDKYSEFNKYAMLDINSTPMRKRQFCFPSNCPEKNKERCDKAIYNDILIKKINSKKWKLKKLKEDEIETMINELGNRGRLRINNYDECIEFSENCFKKINQTFNNRLKELKKELKEIYEQIRQTCRNATTVEFVNQQLKPKNKSCNK